MEITKNGQELCAQMEPFVQPIATVRRDLVVMGVLPVESEIFVRIIRTLESLVLLIRSVIRSIVLLLESVPALRMQGTCVLAVLLVNPVCAEILIMSFSVTAPVEESVRGIHGLLVV